MDNLEITDEIAIKALQGLIESKTRELNNLHAFLDDERNALEAEIRMYERDMKRIKGGGANDR
jgi:hypothetical protein|nr:MAG TPA: hypothetical protein [Caudoviricetes sp.]